MFISENYWFLGFNIISATTYWIQKNKTKPNQTNEKKNKTFKILFHILLYIHLFTNVRCVHIHNR